MEAVEAAWAGPTPPTLRADMSLNCGTLFALAFLAGVTGCSGAHRQPERPAIPQDRSLDLAWNAALTATKARYRWTFDVLDVRELTGKWHVRFRPRSARLVLGADFTVIVSSEGSTEISPGS
jgi:hypothetical protein